MQELNVNSDLIRIRPLLAVQINKLNDMAKRKEIHIMVTHRNKGMLRHRLRSFTPTSAEQSKFTLKDGTTHTVAAYFASTYNIKLGYPNLPCIAVGSSKRPEWIPIELCNVLPNMGAPLTGQQTTTILKQAAVDPETRKAKVSHACNAAQHSTACNMHLLDPWEIRVLLHMHMHRSSTH
jgi:hypothetical protein